MIYPVLTYDHAPAAIDFLCRAFGFIQRLVVPDEAGGIRHSELSLGPGVIMVKSSRPEEQRCSPRTLGGVSQMLSVYVEDPAQHLAEALAAGAEILQALREEAFGASGYVARDPEGHRWYFANYRPGAHWDPPAGD